MRRVEKEREREKKKEEAKQEKYYSVIPTKKQSKEQIPDSKTLKRIVADKGKSHGLLY